MKHVVTVRHVRGVCPPGSLQQPGLRGPTIDRGSWNCASPPSLQCSAGGEPTQDVRAGLAGIAADLPTDLQCHQVQASVVGFLDSRAATEPRDAGRLGVGLPCGERVGRRRRRRCRQRLSPSPIAWWRRRFRQQGTPGGPTWARVQTAVPMAGLDAFGDGTCNLNTTTILSRLASASLAQLRRKVLDEADLLAKAQEALNYWSSLTWFEGRRCSDCISFPLQRPSE